jgi:hypothetical protein
LTYDAALRHFEDGSIDLLHIGDLRTYDAVRHDYEAWLPKLSANAVVLLHDTNVREGESGIFRFWNETAAGKPHFSFLHGCGLGVLGQGRNYPDALQFLFDANDDRCFADSIREMFGMLGRSIRTLSERRRFEQALLDSVGETRSLRQLLAAQESKLAAARRTAAEHINQIGILRQAIHTREGEFIAIKQALAERVGEIGAMQEALTTREGELISAWHILAERTTDASAVRQALSTREGELIAVKQELAEREAEAAAMRQTLNLREGELVATKQILTARTSEVYILRQAFNVKAEELTASRHGLAERTNRIDLLRRALNAREKDLACSRRTLAERAAMIDALTQDLAARASEITAIKQALDARDRDIVSARRAVLGQFIEINTLREAINAGRRLIMRRDDMIFDLLASRSWRFTAPMRYAKSLFTGAPLPIYLRAELIPSPTEQPIPSCAAFSPVWPEPSSARDALPPGVDHYLQVHDHSSPRRDDPLSVANNSPSRREVSRSDTNDLTPSEFDPLEYLALYPDLKAAGVDPTQHFLVHGRAEGRAGRFVNLDALANVDPARETVMVICHDGTRTGSPILGCNLACTLLKRYNVIALFLRPGPFFEACAALGAITIGPSPRSEPALAATVGRVVKRVSIKFAIANTIESRHALPGLAQHFVPSISLVHELASDVTPSGVFLAAAAMWSGQMIFSSPVTMENAIKKILRWPERHFPSFHKAAAFHPTVYARARIGIVATHRRTRGMRISSQRRCISRPALPVQSWCSA